MSDQHSHKPGSLKQQNKSHKHGKHKTKGQMDAQAKGRVAAKGHKGSGGKTTDERRQDKRNHIKQQLKNKREQSALHRRGIGSPDGPPINVAILPVCPDLDARVARAKLIRALLDDTPAADAASSSSTNTMSDDHLSLNAAHTWETDSRASITVLAPKFKKRVNFVVAPRDLFAQLDASVAADIILFLISPFVPTDGQGELLMSCVRAQGVPSVTFATQGLDSIPMKRRNEVRKSLFTYATVNFPKQSKLFSLDGEADTLLLLRHVFETKLESVTWRDRHPYILADRIGFTANRVTDHNGATAPSDVGTLSVSGYLRGRPLSANSLVHLRNFGDFQIARIDGPEDPYLLNPRKAASKGAKLSGKTSARISASSSAMDLDGHDQARAEGAVGTLALGVDVNGIPILAYPDPENRESLVSEVPADQINSEQTWPTEEEVDAAERAAMVAAKKTKVKRVPRGTSEYQAAWIVESDEENAGGDDDGDDEDDGEDEDDGDEDENATGMDISENYDDHDGADAMKQGADDADGDDNDDDDDEYEDLLQQDEDDKYDAELDLTEEQEQLEMKRRAHEQALADETMFPDEVDTPLDAKAWIRFQKYRGLESFRSSPWDPKENLPIEYSRIFQFENFERTKKRVLNDYGGVPDGLYVTVHIENVPELIMADYRTEIPFLIFGVLQHENKMSVCNYVLQRSITFADPIKAKEPLLFQVGFRRFFASPIYSTHTLGNKHKMERFFHSGRVTVATVIAPLAYPPAPVLAFKALEDGSLPYVASGHLLNVNPDRIVLKRIVLTGSPFKINKRSAVIRFMFFNREDIERYKQFELWTKYGRRGHIKGAIGTHGHMSVVFDRQIGSQDTVCLTLYKRTYPKWTYSLYSRMQHLIPLEYVDESDNGPAEHFDQ